MYLKNIIIIFNEKEYKIILYDSNLSFDFEIFKKIILQKIQTNLAKFKIFYEIKNNTFSEIMSDSQLQNIILDDNINNFYIFDISSKHNILAQTPDNDNSDTKTKDQIENPYIHLNEKKEDSNKTDEQQGQNKDILLEEFQIQINKLKEEIFQKNDIIASLNGKITELKNLLDSHNNSQNSLKTKDINKEISTQNPNHKIHEFSNSSKTNRNICNSIYNNQGNFSKYNKNNCFMPTTPNSNQTLNQYNSNFDLNYNEILDQSCFNFNFRNNQVFNQTNQEIINKFRNMYNFDKNIFSDTFLFKYITGANYDLKKAFNNYCADL